MPALIYYTPHIHVHALTQCPLSWLRLKTNAGWIKSHPSPIKQVLDTSMFPAAVQYAGQAPGGVSAQANSYAMQFELI